MVNMPVAVIPALAFASAPWQGAGMNKRQSTAGGGILIALGAIGGAVGGFFAGQASLGLIIGVAAGIALALLLWLRDRS